MILVINQDIRVLGGITLRILDQDIRVFGRITLQVIDQNMRVYLLLFITKKYTIIHANLKLINAKIHSFYSVDIH